MTKYEITSITSPYQTMQSLGFKIKDLRYGILQKSPSSSQPLAGLSINIYPEKRVVVYVRMTAHRNIIRMHYSFHKTKIKRDVMD